MAETDEWGGVAVAQPQADDWGGVAVDQSPKDDWGGIPVAPKSKEEEEFFSSSTPGTGEFSQFLKGAVPSALSPSVVQTEAPPVDVREDKLPFIVDKEHQPPGMQFWEGYRHDPIIPIPKPENTGVGSALVRSAVKFAEGAETRENVGILSGLSAAPKIIQGLASLGFGTALTKNALDRFTEAPENETTGQKVERYADGLLSLLAGGMALKHGMDGRPSGGGVVPEIGETQKEANARVRGNTFTQEQADSAIRQRDLARIQQEAAGPAVAREVQPMDPEVMDGLHLAREKLVNRFQQASEEARAPLQAAIDEIDGQLLEADRNAVAESRARVAERGQSTPVESAPAAEAPPGGPSPTSSRSALFEQLRKESEGEPVAPVTETPVAEVTIDPVMAKAAADSAERIADQVTQGQPTTVREAARDAALDNAMSSLRSGKNPNVGFMRKSAQEAAGRSAGKQAESLDAPVGEGETTKGEMVAAPEQVRTNQELYAPLEDAITSTFSERDAKIIRDVFEGERTMEEIGAEHGITKARVSKIAQEGAKKLREALAERGITKEDYQSGPGAMGPVERMEQRANAAITSTKNAVTNLEREARGEEALVRQESIGNQETMNRAREVLAENPGKAEAIIERLRTTNEDVRNISVQDEALLAAHKIELQKQRIEQEDIYGSGSRSPEERAVAEQKLNEIEAKMNAVDEATFAGGSSWGRFGNFRRQMWKQDFSREAIETKMRRAKGGEELTPQERETAKTQSKEISDALEKTQKAQEELDIAQQDLEVQRITEATINELGKAYLAKPAYGKEVFDIARGIVDRWKEEAQSSRAEIRKALGLTLGGIPNPVLVVHVAKLLRAKIGEFGLNKAEAFTQMVGEFGEKIRPVLESGWKKAQELIGAEKAPAKVKETTKQGIKKAGEKTSDEAVATAKAEAVTGEELSQKTVYEVVRALINEGIHGEKELMKGAHERLEPLFPGLTERDVRRAYTKYGEARFPSQDAVKKEMRELNTLVRLQESIDRETEGLNALRSGLQRDKATQAIRDKQKQLNELLKKRKGPPSEEALASREEAKQTALRNSIADLDRQLRTGEKPVRGEPTPDSPATEQLRAERDAMRAKLREIEDAQKERPTEVDLQIRALEKTLSDLSDKMAGKKEETPPKEWKALSDRAENLQAEIQAMRQLSAEMKRAAAPRVSEEQKQIDQLQKVKDRLDETLSGKRPPNAPKDWNPLSTEAENLKAEITAMQELAAQLRREAKPPGDPGAKAEAAKIAALEKSIAALDDKISRSDFSTESKTKAGPDSKQVAELKEIRKARREVYEAAKKAGKPVESPEQRYNQQRLNQVNNRIAELQEMIDSGKFAKRPKPVPKEKAQAVLDAELEMRAKQHEVDKAIHQIELANRKLGRRIWDGIKATGGVITNIASSFDFSAGRQALGALLYQGSLSALPFRIGIDAAGKIRPELINPTHSAKRVGLAAGRMFRGWASEKFTKELELKREKRPNAQSGADKLAGIEYSKLDTDKFSKYEENAHSVLDDWAALPLKTGNPLKSAVTAPAKVLAKGVRMSNRAFVTFLNETRAMLFDHLLDINFRDRPPTAIELQQIGNMINQLTGRGKIKPGTASFLGKVLWSPKLLASRVQTLAGQPFLGGSARSKAIVADAYARVIMSGFLLWKVGQLFSDKKENDTRSSDAGKVVRGNTRIDLWGGYQQPVVWASRVLSAERKTAKGEIQDIGAARKYGVPGPLAVSVDFLRSKLRPEIGALVNLADRKGFGGQKVEPVKDTAKLFVPLPLQDIAKIMKDRGFTEGMIIEALGQFGAGVQVHDEARPDREMQR